MRSLQHLCLFLAVVGAPLLISACAGGSSLPPPRSVIVFTGVRIQPDAERMAEVDRWLDPQLEEIRRGRGFTIMTLRTERAEYPWQSMEVGRDTTRIFVQQIAPDTQTPFAIYAHLHMMALRGELEAWLPGAHDLEGFELERAILERISDVWLYGRSVFNTQPYGPLDELIYADEFGFLDEFILASRPEQFDELQAAHMEEHPERWEAFERWFEETFERDGPGFIHSRGRPAEEDVEGPRRRRGR